MSEIATGGAPASAAPVSVSPETAADTSLEATEAAEGEEAEASEPAPVETPAEKKSNKKKLKLKVDGKEFDEEIDLDDIEGLTKHIQLSKAASKRMQEYASLEKDVKSFVEELRKNPRKILSDPTIGVDIKQLAAEIIESEIANSKKSPEQLEKERIQSELETLKAEREREKEENKQKEFTRLQAQEFERYENKMTKALENNPDLPKSPYVVKKMADYMLMGLQKGMVIEPEDVVDLVRQEIKEDLKQMFAVLPEDVVESLVGKDKINGIRKKNLAKAKAPATASQVKDTGRAGEKPSTAQKQSFKDFFKKV